ncbi:MAG: M15 family metallopeptidase [Clostridium sp.]
MGKNNKKSNNFKVLFVSVAVIFLSRTFYETTLNRQVVEADICVEAPSDNGNIKKNVDQAVGKNSIDKDNEESRIKKIIEDDKDSIVRLVNENNPIDNRDLKESLVIPRVSLVEESKNEKNHLRVEASKALEKMLNDAKEQSKLTIYLSSGYRSKERQTQVYNAKVYNSGDKNQEFVAKPGHSEHQTGLAVDLTARSVKFKLIQDFQYTSEGKWLYENAHKYGFVLRYPKDKTEETGYSFEPWHFRYVGEEVSSYMKKNNLTLEGLYKKLNLAP